MAHARRKFHEVSQSANKKKGMAHEALAILRKLYYIEQTAIENNLNPDEIKQLRQEKSTPILDSFETWCLEKSRKVPLKSPIGKAIAYTMNHWTNLTRYFEDGRLEIDNNRSDRAIKPFVIGRKNWLFNDSVKGAEAGAKIYSLIETCKVYHIDPYTYLRFMLKRIPLAKTVEDYEALLPYNCDRSELLAEVANDREIVSRIIINGQERR